MADRFEDHRGVIQDIIGRIDAVTRITTVKGAVRGNHYHEKTTQWTLVLSGKLLMATGSEKTEMWPGQVVKHEPGVPHAWKALEDSECVVFAKGPRAGDEYDTDTFRLEEPLLS